MIWAVLIGYAVGSIPSADAIARWRGHDLRSSGSGNPGTANALQVAGRGVAVAVLLIDLLKGAAAVVIGGVLAGGAGEVAGGVAAIAGQVYNPWFGFAGGKGLGVTAGVTAVAWPPGLLVVMPFTSIGATFLTAAWGAVFGLSAYVVGAGLWAANDWPTWWGIESDDRLVWMAIGVVALTLPKFITDIVNRGR
jgi:glycerol-3-phosphate acyltransferase PlsY